MPRQQLALFEWLVGQVSLEAVDPLASTVTLGIWLPRALADIYALLLNIMRPEKAPITHRDEILDSWGLGYEARQDRLNIERGQSVKTKIKL